MTDIPDDMKCSIGVRLNSDQFGPTESIPCEAPGVVVIHHWDEDAQSPSFMRACLGLHAHVARLLAGVLSKEADS